MAASTELILKKLTPTLSQSLQKSILDTLHQCYPDVEIKKAIFLSEPERRNVLVRIYLEDAKGDAPNSLIFKQVLAQESVVHSDKKADERFYRDWAGLEFSNMLQQEQLLHLTPEFYGSNHKERYILIEDLGESHISLVDSLTSKEATRAIAALSRFMTTLGQFHALSVGRADEYDKFLRKISADATTVEQDKKVTAETFQQIVQPIDCDKVLFKKDIDSVLSAMFDPGPFTVLTHGDCAPDNVFDNELTGLKLIDFEWASPRNALLDGTYLRMSMPTSWCAKLIPDEVLLPLEASYREQLSGSIIEARDDVAYSTAYTHACAFHALYMMVLFNKLDKITKPEEDIWPSGPLARTLSWSPDSNSFRSRFLTRLKTFLQIADKHDQLLETKGLKNGPVLHGIRSVAQSMLTHARNNWLDVKELQVFSAFNSSATSAFEGTDLLRATVPTSQGVFKPS